MDLHRDILRQLSTLTFPLENDPNLQSLLQELVDQLEDIVPGFLGLDLTVGVDGEAVTLTTLDGQAGQVKSTLGMPLFDGVDGVSPGFVVYYSSADKAFLDLAADALVHQQASETVVVDGHLVLDGRRPGLMGLAELIARNQGIGMLLERGYPLEQAKAIARGELPHPNGETRSC